MSFVETEQQKKEAAIARQQFIDALLETSQQFAERARRMSPPMEVQRNPMRKPMQPMQPVQTPPIFQTDPPETFETKPMVYDPRKNPRKLPMFRKGLDMFDPNNLLTARDMSF